MIELSGLTKRFGPRLVLDDLHFRIEPGERVALLGLNGAGKTTLLRCVMGLLSFRGAVRVDDVDVSAEGKRARGRIGYVPQRPPRFAMTLDSMVEFFSTVRGIAPARIEAELGRLGLPLTETGDLSLDALSGGMLQKTLLAIALAADPPVLLLDEPTANLDPRARADFMRALGDVEEGTTVLLASHRLDEVEALADRVWILHGGHTVFDGSLEDLRTRAGGERWLWVETTRDRREEVRDRFLRQAGREAVLANGARVGVRLPAVDRAAELCRLQSAGIPIDDFWIETPSLEEIVRDFFEETEGRR